MIKIFGGLFLVIIIAVIVSTAGFIGKMLVFLAPLVGWLVLRKNLPTPKRPEANIYKITVISAAFIVFWQILIAYFLPSSRPHVANLSYLGLAIFIVSTVLLGPLCEELFFRRSIFCIIETYSKTYALLASAAIFSFMHFERWLYVLVPGLIFTLTYAKTRSLKSTVIVHGCSNLTLLIIMLKE